MHKSTQLCGLAGVRLQLAVPPVQYERRIVEAGFCGGFVAPWLRGSVVYSGFRGISHPENPNFLPRWMSSMVLKGIEESYNYH